VIAWATASADDVGIRFGELLRASSFKGLTKGNAADLEILLHTRWQIDAHRDVGDADMTVTIRRGAERPSRKRPVTQAPAVIAEVDHLVARHRATIMIFATFVRIQHVDEDQHRLRLRHPWRG